MKGKKSEKTQYTRGKEAKLSAEDQSFYITQRKTLHFLSKCLKTSSEKLPTSQNITILIAYMKYTSMEGGGFLHGVSGKSNTNWFCCSARICFKSLPLTFLLLTQLQLLFKIFIKSFLTQPQGALWMIRAQLLKMRVKPRGKHLDSDYIHAKNSPLK